MDTKIEKQILERRVFDADKRLAEIEALERVVAAGTYQAQELACERLELARIRNIAALKLRALATGRPEDDVRHRAMVERLIAERRAQTLAYVEKLTREGDHRQARIHRLSMLDIPRQVERECS
jgi:hypothetical protein